MLNRIILIGNGFDLAHEMPTSYNNFITDYWSMINNHLMNNNGEYISDDFSVHYTYTYNHNDILNVVANSTEYLQDFYKEYARHNANYADLILNNHFLFDISKISFDNWVDIENEYYNILLELVKDKSYRFGGIQQLNKDLLSIRNNLNNYLANLQANFKHSNKIVNHIRTFLNEPFKMTDISEEAKKKIYKDKWEQFKNISLNIDQTIEPHFHTDHFDKYIFSKVSKGVYDEKAFYDLIRINEHEFFRDKVDFPEIVTFNYTSTEEVYNEFLDFNTTHIHGEILDETNPLIFGYGDELDDLYPSIEKLQDNFFLDNMKSINYSKTTNYKHLLSVLESGLFQVYIMGHSCGNSDRTLLNTIFEHDNCASIKIFFYQDSEKSDRYLETYKNISRNFNNKAKLRDRVVNWQLSEPLVPYNLKLEAMEELKK